jgi:hypothetical protein
VGSKAGAWGLGCGVREAVFHSVCFVDICYVHLGSKVKVKEPQKFHIWDNDHKVLVLDSGLRAIL